MQPMASTCASSLNPQIAVLADILLQSAIQMVSWTSVGLYVYSHMWCASRLRGSAEFRHKLLARHGQVVVIPYHKLSREGVKAELEAAVGVPLHQAFNICTKPFSKPTEPRFRITSTTVIQNFHSHVQAHEVMWNRTRYIVRLVVAVITSGTMLPSEPHAKSYRLLQAVWTPQL